LRQSLLAAAGLVLMGCAQSGAGKSLAPTPALLPANVYAAIGASETVGVGADHPEREAWTQVFYATALPRSAVFYNFGEPGATAADALQREVPQALGVKPDLVTVWLNTNDIVHSVPVASYEATLDRLVAQARQGGEARVLVANTPVLDGLPAYRDCLQPMAGPHCLIHDQTIPTPDQVRSLVDAYNVAIERVVQRNGATLVDIHCQGDMAAAHPDWVSSDGFHPGTRGHAAIARAFAAAARGQRCIRPS
jgi:lysophospholipase L1-like esterase